MLGLFGHVMLEMGNVNCMCWKKYNLTPLPIVGSNINNDFCLFHFVYILSHASATGDDYAGLLDATLV